MAYFMSAYIVSSPFEGYLAGLYIKDAEPEDALSSAIHAASFAAFGQRIRDINCMEASRRKYAVALTRTNAALACPESAILDKTLAAVLLLGVYETLVFQGQKSPENWTAHTLGAVGLLRLRGLRQFESRTARQLFAQTANNIRTSCVQRGVPVPEEFVSFNDEALPFLDPKDPAVRLGPIVERAALLRSRRKVMRVSALVKEALSIDRELLSLIEGFEDSILYKRRSKEETPSWAYFDTAASYPTRRAAKFWNAIRMLRMFVNELVWDKASRAVDDIDDQTFPASPSCRACESEYWIGLEEDAAKNMADLAKGVLGSVPDFIEADEPGGRFAPSARTLVWPLTIMVNSQICPPLAIKFALAVLLRLGRDLHLPQAVSTAQRVDPSIVKEDW